MTNLLSSIINEFHLTREIRDDKNCTAMQSTCTCIKKKVFFRTAELSYLYS